jgi:hypothetical protein
VAVVLIERESLAKRLLRITITLPYAFAGETRIIIDEEPIRSRSYSPLANRCTADYNVCTTDYEATPELIGKLKKDRRANGGPPGDPKAFEAQQKIFANLWYKPR